MRELEECEWDDKIKISDDDNVSIINKMPQR